MYLHYLLVIILLAPSVSLWLERILFIIEEQSCSVWQLCKPEEYRVHDGFQNLK